MLSINDTMLIRNLFEELTPEEKEQNKELPEIEGLSILTSILTVSTKADLEIYKNYLSMFNEAITSNVKKVHKIENYIDKHGLNNKMLIQEGFTHIKLDGNTYYYNILADYEKGHIKFSTNRKYSQKFFDIANTMSDEEFKKEYPKILKSFGKNTKHKFIPPVFKGFMIELIAVVEK